MTRFTDQPEKPFKAEEGERIFFSLDDKISMSIEYYDPDSTDRKSGSMALLNASTPANGIKAAAAGAAKENNNTMGNPNKRYLECPGSVKVQSLKKFIAMKYGLSEEFVVDVIYRNDLIPEDYSLVDIAYAYNWRKDVPMQVMGHSIIIDILIFQKCLVIPYKLFHVLSHNHQSIN